MRKPQKYLRVCFFMRCLFRKRIRDDSALNGRVKLTAVRRKINGATQDHGRDWPITIGDNMWMACG